jgi:hypothetical protein
MSNGAWLGQNQVPASYINAGAITAFQKWLHSSTTPSEKLDPSFSYDFIRIPWQTNYLETIEGVVDNDDSSTVVFNLSPNSHVCYYSTLTMTTPDVTSTTSLIAWPDNLFHNFVQKATLKFNDLELTSMDHVFFDGSIQLLPIRSGPGKREQYLRDIGNFPMLTTFSKHLPSRRLSFPLPWSFSREESPPFPLFMTTGASISMSFKLERIPNLLRVLDGNVYRRYQVDPGITFSRTAPVLKMTSRYGTVTEREVLEQRKYFSYLILDTISSMDAPVQNGEAVRVINTDGLPCRALMVMAENTTSTEVNNRSNYSTDPEDSYAGEGPLTTIAQTVVAQNPEAAETFSNDEPYWTGKAAPERPGYYFISFSPNPNRYFDIGRVNPGTLTVTLGDDQPYNLRIRAVCSQIWKFNLGMVPGQPGQLPTSINKTYGQ